MRPDVKPSLVDRCLDLSRLEEGLDRAANGTPTTLLIGGEAGVGKTRLLREFVDIVRSRGIRVVIGACVDLGAGALPYAPLVDALRTLVRDLGANAIRDLAGPALPTLARLVPFLGEARGVDSPDHHTRSLMFEGVLRLLDQLAPEAPVVLIFEDVHWADRSTLDLLAFLIGALTRERVLVVASYRTSDLHPRHPLRSVLAEVDRARRAERFELRPFNRDELREFMAHLLDREPRPAEVQRMLTLSDGNAYFVEALVADGAHAAPATAATHLPGGLRDVLIPRIRMMSDEAQEVLRAAATAGRHVSHRLLAAAAEQPERQLNSALRECVDQQLLTVRPGADTYTFRHALAREAVYEDLLPGERIRLHQSLASALESDPSLAYTEAGSVATELAHHWSEAGEPARALAASVAAGRDAADVCAFGESERQFSRALRLWERVPDPERLAAMSRLELLRRAADAARWAGHVEAAIAATRDALASVDPSLGVERAAVLERLGRYLREAGDSDGTLRAYEEADRLLVDQPPSALRAGVRAARAGARLQAGEYSLGLLLGREAVQMARAVGSAREEGRALNTTGVALTMTGHPDEGVDAVRNALAIAQEHGDLEDLHRAYANLTFVLENAGRLEEALKVARQGLDQGRRIGLGPEGSCAHSFRIAILLFELGRWTEAGKMAVEALEREIPARFALYFELLLAELDIYHGRFDNADRRLASIRPTVARLNEPQSTGALHACLAELAIWRRERGPARTTIADGLKAVCDAEDAPQVLRLCAYGLRAEADEAQRLSDLGQGDSGPARTARDVGDDLWTRAEQAGTGPDGAPPLPEVSVLTLLCRAEHARLHGSNDPDVWARVAAGWRGLQRLYPSAYAEWRWAEALADGPHRDRGRITPVLRNAYRTAEALKAGPLLREIEVLALRAGDIKLDPPPTRPDRPEPAPAPYRLTPREQEVLHYVGLGFTNKQIAKKLRIEEKTVSVHVTHILTKLDVQNRVQAAGIAHRLGLGTTE